MNQENNKIMITTFTDPMMGLSYECEPIFRKLETHFEGMIEFRYVMSVLVRDVYQLVDKSDLAKGKEIAIRNYNVRLAKIYESEESISGMPINMTDFHLFSMDQISSIPLNIAYKAAQLTDKNKADLFLYHLRYATIVDGRQTTKPDEILKVVSDINIDTETFLKYYNDGTAQEMLHRDLQLGYELGIRTLPSYFIQYEDRALLIQSLIDYDDFVSAIGEITDGQVKPKKVNRSIENLCTLLNAHPLISPIEIREAFDFRSVEEVREFVKPLVENKEISIRDGFYVLRDKSRTHNNLPKRPAYR